MSAGIRWFRSDSMDLLPGLDVLPRRDDLREMVDGLPDRERFIVERCFFGGAPMRTVAKELKVSEKYARIIRQQAFDRLRELLLGVHDPVGAVPSDGVGGF